MISVLVTGKDSQLALCLKDLEDNYPNISCKYYDSKSLNIEDLTSIEEVFSKNEFHYCINCAAYTNVDKAELESQKAIAVNTIGALNLAKACKNHNVTLIHISTDFVFDGYKNEPYTEEDITNPLNAYGKSKRDGELEIIRTCPTHFIIRTSWLYSEYGSNFLKKILKLTNRNNNIQVVNNHFGSPTYAGSLAEVILIIITSSSKAFGIYHYCNEGETTWFDFANEIVRAFGKQIKITPINSNDYKTKAARPKYSCLSTIKISEKFQLKPIAWQEPIKKLSKSKSITFE